jgi:hypothetical protein
MDPRRWVMTSVEADGLELLLQRLTWPSGLVRERACVSLGSLMADTEFAAEIINEVLAWIGKQNLESVAVLGMLALFQGKAHGIEIPTHEAVSQQLQKPSLLSWLIARSLYKHSIGAPELGTMHSDTAPVGFEADPFFLKHAGMFVPPVYLERATKIDSKYCPGFLAQWKFEWTHVVELSGIPLHIPRIEFWTRQDDDHLLCIDLPLSEAYRSAYLRAIAWAADRDFISPGFALWLAAQTCPIDLGLWQVPPGRPPEGWPRCEETQDSIDTLPGKLTGELAAMWQRQSGQEWLIAEASGRVLETANSAYDVEIIGVIQACNGANEPDLEDIARRGQEIRIAEESDDLMVFGGGYTRKRAADYEEGHDDWSIWRLAAPVDPSPVPRWQWWRFRRGVWLPSPFLAEKRFEFRCTKEGVVVEENGRELARWIDWTYRLREVTTGDLTPSTGQMLVIHRSIVEREASKLGGVYAWVCRMTSHHRKYSYTDFKEANFALDFGTTRIVRE